MRARLAGCLREGTQSHTATGRRIGKVGEGARKVDGRRGGRTIAPMRILLAVLLCSFPALAAPGRIGLYPLSLPDGQAQLGDRLSAQLHEGAAVLPGVRAFDLVAHSACGADEAPCLAAAARHAGLEAMISAAVTASDSGYRFQLREVAADGALLHESRGEVRGGPLDLAGALEHGVCELLSAGPCEGELRVLGERRSPALPEEVNSVHQGVVVDGEDRGALPVTLRLPIGRHLVQVGDAERRVRIAYDRTALLTAAMRAGSLALLDAPAPPASAAPLAAVSAAAPAPQPRATAARLLFGSGLALLVAGAGVALYSGTSAGAQTHAGLAAAALAATGAGATLAGGLLLALTPSGAALHGEF